MDIPPGTWSYLDEIHLEHRHASLFTRSAGDWAAFREEPLIHNDLSLAMRPGIPTLCHFSSKWPNINHIKQCLHFVWAVAHLSHTVMMTVSMQLIIVIPQMLSFDRVALSGYIQYFSQKV
jgi:hypothetical protein